MIAAIPVGVTTGSFLSGDGTLMGYRQMGKGPGLVLLHGALQSSRSFTSLGAALSDAFTIYIPDVAVAASAGRLATTIVCERKPRTSKRFSTRQVHIMCSP